MAGELKTFRSKKKNKALVFIGVAVIIAILAYILVSRAFITFRIYKEYSEILRYVIPCIVGLTAGIIAAVTGKQTVITIDDDTFTYTKGKTVESYPLDSFAGTNVVRNYMNGGYVGSTRYIRFALPDNKIKQFDIPFDEKDYSDIVALLDRKKKTNTLTEEVKEEINNTFEGEMTIDIPREDLSAAFAKSRKVRAAFSIITLVISLSVCIVSFILLDIWSFLAMFVLFGLLGTTLAVAIFLYGRKESLKALEATPSSFTVKAGSIVFGDEEINASDISKIVVTPPGYDTTGKEYEFRKIVITNKSGTDRTYYFGKTPKGDKKMVVYDYQAVVSTLDMWCFSHNIEFRQDLG